MTAAAPALISPRALSEAFKDPSRMTWDFPVAHITDGYRFLFNEVCGLLPSFAGEDHLIEELLLATQGGWEFTTTGPACGEADGSMCQECGELLVEDDISPERLVDTHVRMKLNYDNLKAMYSTVDAVGVSFVGKLRCAGCGHPHNFSVDAELPTPHILGVIHAQVDF